MHSLTVAVSALATAAWAASSASGATFELNAAGTFAWTGTSVYGTSGTITNVGERTLDDALLGRVRAAMLTGVNGHTSSLNPVAVSLDTTMTLDKLVVNTDDEPAGYPGAGWVHQVRYNGADLSGWRLVTMFARTYSPDSGFANTSYEQLDVDSYSDDFLNANLPFTRETERRDGTTEYGAYAIADSTQTTWYTINGSWLEMENTYLLARTVGDTLEVGAAWGFHERVSVPAPASAVGVVIGLAGVTRRRR